MPSSRQPLTDSEVRSLWQAVQRLYRAQDLLQDDHPAEDEVTAVRYALTAMLEDHGVNPITGEGLPATRG